MLKILSPVNTYTRRAFALFNRHKRNQVNAIITNLHPTRSLNLAPRVNMQVRNNASSNTTCWKCGATRHNVKHMLCDTCMTIQAVPDREDFFELFDRDHTYDVNNKELAKKYKEMQSLLHPDKFTNKSEEEKRISQEYSSLVNKAYSTLTSPMYRALYILELNDEHIGEDTQASDPNFLGEIMELNEEIEDASTERELRALDSKNRKMLDDIIKELSHHFERGDIAKAKENVIKMKYYDSISKRINELMRERGIVD